MEWLSPITHVLNALGTIPFLHQSTATELAFLFLSSKPVFVAAALWVGFWSRRARLPEHAEPSKLESPSDSSNAS